MHLYIFFTEWTEAKTVRDILHTFLYKLDLPPETECFPKQVELSEKDTGNGIMLPFMYGVGNDWIKSFNKKQIFTGTLDEFLPSIESVDAESIKIELPTVEKTKEKPEEDLEKELNEGLTKWEILKALKDGTIEQHPTMGGKYHSWIQVIIAKCVKEDFGDNEILKLIQMVHQDSRGLGYAWPESYQKQINYTRKDERFNKPNPGDTKFLEKQSLDNAVKLDEITKTYCYIMANDMFNKIGSADFYKDIQINNFHKHEVFLEKGTLANKLLSRRQFAKAETFITSAKYKPGLMKIDRPGIIPLVNKGTVLNIYIPNYLIAKKGDVNFIIEFFAWLIGEKKWKIIEQWLAYMLQFPGEKMKWAVVLVSAIEGVGKGLLARICSRVLGSDNVNENANYKHLTNTHNTLLIGTQLLVLNEVSLGDFKSKQEGTNTLKNFVADDIYSCNFKGKTMVKLANLTNFMLFSNDERVVGAPQGGRRYFFNNIQKSEKDIIHKTNEGFFEKAWNFVDSDEGASALLHYFKNEVKITDTTIFKKRAPETDDLIQLIEQTKHPLIKKLEFDLTRPDIDKRRIFDRNWCGIIIFDWLNDQLHSSSRDDTTQFNWGSFGDDAIYKFLTANAIPWNNGENTRQISINGVKHRFYNLDEDRCPIPNKSYKDLTPKQIEAIYKHYTSIVITIRDQGEDLEKAKIKLNDNIKNLKGIIKENIAEANKGKTKFNSQFKDLTIDGAYEKLINGEIEVINKNPVDCINNIKASQKTINIGIRTPEQIVESYIDGATINE
ncbi:MAG: hypothetical protein HQ480_03195 [Candidatus Pelagibacter sp.]|nr:hypothetical protein [Candidatus Pelagibacter sp.]